MRRPSGIDASSPTRWPRKVLAMAGLFALICFALQAWRLFSLSATYDQALFLQELWATAQGRPFESSLSSVLSGAVVVGDGLPSIDYLHLGQHANVLTVLMAPLVAVFGMWAAVASGGLAHCRRSGAVAIGRLPTSAALG